MPLSQEEEDTSLAHVIVKHKTILDLKETIDGHKSRPHTVGVGFTVPYSSMMQIRKQIIVVVTDDWQVLCYSPDLTLMWHQQLPLPNEDFHSIEVKSLAALVSPLSIEKNHNGLVIVSGSFRHKTEKPDLFAQIKAREAQKSKNRTLELSAEEENETLTDFYTFALSAKDGSILWKHAAGDSKDGRQEAKEYGDIHWKLGLRHKHTYKGESEWSDFGNQLDQFFPHSWAENADTEIIVARINKQFGKETKESHDSPESDVSTAASALLPEHFIGFSYGGQRPHSDHEHVKNPNSLVVRSPEGLQVLSLVTGQPKTGYSFPADTALYMDLDGDGNMEKLVWNLGQHYSPCFLDIWRTQPVQEKLEQISLCSSRRLFWVRSWSLEEDVYKKIPPKLIKSVARKSGVLRHFLGHNLFKDSSYDIISMGGMGRISSYSLDGNCHWQILTESKWGDISLGMRRTDTRPIANDMKEEFLLSFQPSRIIMPLVEAGPKVALAVTGWNSISLVDLVEGYLLAEHSIPAPPTGPLVYGDFDNDGLMDLILTCKKGYIGFSLKLQHNYELTVLYTVAVFLIIILFSWLISSSTQKDEEEEEDDDDEDYEVVQDYRVGDEMIVGGDDEIGDTMMGYGS